MESRDPPKETIDPIPPLKDPPERRPWQPRMVEDHELNPFVRSTAPGNLDEDQPTIADLAAQTDESEAREDDPEPIKIP